MKHKLCFTYREHRPHVIKVRRKPSETTSKDPWSHDYTNLPPLEEFVCDGKVD